MLFDLKSGRRRRVIQVIFGLLAFLFFISFVGFGIGSDVSGGIFDALGLSNGSSGAAQYEDQIEDAEEALQQNPDDEEALIELVRLNFLAATEDGIDINQQTGVPNLTEEQRDLLEASVAAWNDYLAAKPRRPDAGAASNAAQAFVYLQDFDGAAKAQRIVAEDQRSSFAYSQLARYLYIDGRLEAGDEAGDEAVKAAEASQRGTVRKTMDQLAKAARRFQKQLEKARKQGGGQDGGAALENPFGALGGGAGLGQATP